MSSIGVLGAGTWGTALSRLLSVNGHDVTVWSAVKAEVESFSAARIHPNLPGMMIPEDIIYTENLEEACRAKDLVMFAVPSVYVRSVAAQAVPFLSEDQLIVSVAKGIEKGTSYTMTQVIRDELSHDGKHENVRMSVLTGPTHAEEVALDKPAAIVAASEDLEAARFVQKTFMNSNFRVYTSSDIDGVQLCGAVKNVIALACGMSEGLGFGDNARAALITRGMAELTRLGTAMGCLEQTFSGLAGMGDLIVTATSSHSRNNRCGYLIGKGVPVEEAVKQIGMVVEGMNALDPVLEMAAKFGVQDMPITKAVGSIVNEGTDPAKAVFLLMNREGKGETEKSPLDITYESAVLKNQGRSGMKRVITYGSFDMLDYGHINLLRRAKALGDYLIVALSTNEFSEKEKERPCYFSYEQRKSLLEAMRYVDLVIPEESWEQKPSDMKEYCVDTFVIGDDWRGRFDYLKKEGVEVIYLPKTPHQSVRDYPLFF